MFTMIRNGIAVVALMAAGGVALAGSGEKQDCQKNNDAHCTNQKWQQVIKQMEGDGISLEEAISQATERVGGHAISSRILTDCKCGEAPQPASPEVANKMPHYRFEVLCLTENGRFKVVTVNGLDGKILGTANAARSDGFRDYAGPDRVRMQSWRTGDDDFTVFRLMKCSSLEDTTVTNTAGQDLGHLADFAVDPHNGRVSYAALSFGGWLELGDKLVAVPLGALDIHSPDVVGLNLTKKQLEDTKGFDEDHWPIQPNDQLLSSLDPASSEAYKLAAYKDRQKQQRMERAKDQDKQHSERTERITGIEQASDLVGMTVKNKQGEELGTIDELYIDPDRARVAYAVLSHGGWLGMGDKLFAIPWQSFQTRTKRGDNNEMALILDVSRDRLKNAPGAREADGDTWSDPDWMVTVYDFFGVTPYWTDQEVKSIR